MNLDALDITILGPAFLAGVLVLATHVPLGRQVLARGIIFIDLAIAQAAGLGVIIAGVLGWDLHGAGAQAAAFAAAIVGALGLAWADARFAYVQEAIIGVFFVLCATGGLILLANNPHGGEELKDLLVGQILWVDMRSLLPAAIVSVLVLTAWFGWRERLGRAGFYLMFALSVTVSVQLVGVYLVFASLIVPALATRKWPNRSGLVWAYGVGAMGYIVGLVLSAVLDLPTGAVIVWSLAGLAVMMSALRAITRRPLPTETANTEPSTLRH
jgi:zinc/manganese transport system permease protein